MFDPLCLVKRLLFIYICIVNGIGTRTVLDIFQVAKCL